MCLNFYLAFFLVRGSFCLLTISPLHNLCLVHCGCVHHCCKPTPIINSADWLDLSVHVFTRQWLLLMWWPCVIQAANTPSLYILIICLSVCELSYTSLHYAIQTVWSCGSLSVPSCFMMYSPEHRQHHTSVLFQTSGLISCDIVKPFVCNTELVYTRWVPVFRGAVRCTTWLGFPE